MNQDPRLALNNRVFAPRIFSYGETRTMLYGLAVGMGRDPLDRQELPFVTECGLKALPSQATVVAWDDTWLPLAGIDVSRVVHGEQRVTLHKPLAPAAEVEATIEILDIFDKGAGRGAVLYVQTRLKDLADGQPLATLHSTVFARGDGGFGGEAGSPPELARVPEREPDCTVLYESLPSQALLYRLLGDMNPLHSDPDFAQSVGFYRPILHGLCTYGIACRAVVKAVCDHDPSKVKHMEARFTAPVYPGEAVLTEMWRTERGAAFRATVPARGVVVLDRGSVVL